MGHSLLKVTPGSLVCLGLYWVPWSCWSPWFWGCPEAEGPIPVTSRGTGSPPKLPALLSHSHAHLSCLATPMLHSPGPQFLHS